MCLDQITKRYEKPRQMIGYKFFEDWGDGDIAFPFETLHKEPVVPRGEWLTAEKKPIAIDTYGNGYVSGFHAHVKKGGPKDYRIRVRLRGVRILGLQSGNEVVVADEMYVPKPQKTNKRKGA